MSARRRLFVSLAAIALAALLLRPACELWLAHGGAGVVDSGAASLAAGASLGHEGGSATPCCASFSDSHQMSQLQAVSGRIKALGSVAPAAFLALIAGLVVLTWRPRWLRAPPRSPQSFYLRSARILR